MFIKNIDLFLKRRRKILQFKSKGNLLYFDVFYALKTVLKIHKSFLAKEGDEKEKKREEVENKTLLIFQILKERLRNRENEWETSAVQGAWISVSIFRIFILKKMIECFIKKTEDNQKLQREGEKLLSYLLMASNKKQYYQFLPKEEKLDE